MHDSAHDKAQRQRGVLRRGKCVQRALRGVVTRLRTRRTLVVTAALVLLLVLALLALCHARLLSLHRPAHRDGAHDDAAADAVADDSTSRVAALLTDRWLLRPDAQHGGSVRVMLLMVSTHVSEQLCYALASAYFADLPVVVVGFNTTPFVNAMKPSLFLDAIQRAGLRDRDVVLLLDSDILFSGEDMLPFIDDYIARSPAAPSALDVRAVRAGTARAPSMFAAEFVCVAKHNVKKKTQCVSWYDTYYDAIAAYVASTGVAYDLHNASLQPLRYLNGGVSIHRVWSLRELTKALQHYVATHAPREQVFGGWYDDQSVFALFYNDLRVWEVEHDVLRNYSNAAAAQQGRYGLRAGQLQLEQTGRLSSVIYKNERNANWFSVKAWTSTKNDTIHDDNSFCTTDVSNYTNSAWRRYGGGVRLQQRTLTRASNGTHTVDLTPPLLYVASRLDVAHNNTRPAVLTSPLVLHTPRAKVSSKLNKMLLLLRWYMLMRYNVKRWQQGRAQVLSSVVELWTAATNTTQHVRYGDVCAQHHPFMAKRK